MGDLGTKQANNLDWVQWNKMGSVFWVELLTWVNDHLGLCSWFQTGTANCPSSNICPVHHPLPAVIVNSHDYGALCDQNTELEELRFLALPPTSCSATSLICSWQLGAVGRSIGDGGWLPWANARLGHLLRHYLHFANEVTKAYRS